MIDAIRSWSVRPRLTMNTMMLLIAVSAPCCALYAFSDHFAPVNRSAARTAALAAVAAWSLAAALPALWVGAAPHPAQGAVGPVRGWKYVSCGLGRSRKSIPDRDDARIRGAGPIPRLVRIIADITRSGTRSDQKCGRHFHIVRHPVCNHVPAVHCDDSASGWATVSEAGPVDRARLASPEAVGITLAAAQRYFSPYRRRLRVHRFVRAGSARVRDTEQRMESARWNR